MRAYTHYKSLIPNQISNKVLIYLKNKKNWNQVKYYSQKAQKEILTPRFTYVYGYHYKNENLSFARTVPVELRELYHWVSKYFGEYYNFMLLTKYTEPNHSISFHSDDESFLIKDSSIISTIFANPNVTRDFQMKNKLTKEIETFELSHGDVFYMSYESQRTHMHSVPKRKQINGTRYGITFRNGNDKAIYNYYKYN
jgi:alkylated DNA repair dioxygenase AlkB